MLTTPSSLGITSKWNITPLLQVLFGVNQRLRVEDVDSPLIQIRPVKEVLLLIVTGDRGLCGGYNSIVIKKVRRC